MIPQVPPHGLALGLAVVVAAVSALAGCASPSSGSGEPAGTAAGGSAPAKPSAPAPAAPGGGGASAAPAPKGDPAPDFSLPDLDGVQHSLAAERGRWVVLEWTNPGCPFVRKHYDSRNMQALQAKYGAKGVTWLTICSSAPGKQGHAEPSAWKDRARGEGWASTLLLDADGKTGRAYGAKTTPHMFVIDPHGSIVYRGAIDDHRSADQADIPKSRNYVAEVLDAALAGKPAPVTETAPYGCSVKY